MDSISPISLKSDFPTRAPTAHYDYPPPLKPPDYTSPPNTQRQSSTPLTAPIRTPRLTAPIHHRPADHPSHPEPNRRRKPSQPATTIRCRPLPIPIDYPAPACTALPNRLANLLLPTSSDLPFNSPLFASHFRKVSMADFIVIAATVIGLIVLGLILNRPIKPKD